MRLVHQYCITRPVAEFGRTPYPLAEGRIPRPITPSCERDVFRYALQHDHLPVISRHCESASLPNDQFGTPENASKE